MLQKTVVAVAVACCAIAVSHALRSIAMAAAPLTTEAMATEATKAELPFNRWVLLADEKIAPTIEGAYAKPIWAPAAGQAVLWFKPGGQYATFSAAQRKWNVVQGEFPKGQQFGGIPESPLCGTYLPGLKKLLFLYPNSTRFSKTSALAWMLDPVSGKWEVQSGDLKMCESATTYNPSGMREDYDVPIWGDVIYDPVNREAMAFGGAGTFGRVSKAREPVEIGDWIYDEQSNPPRLRRLTAVDDKKVSQARRWYSAQSGTWTFSEQQQKWAPTAQPLREQPSGRILSQMAHHTAAGKIMLFGGDDRTKCLGDTWVYDCATRNWKQMHPKTAPPARAAHALLYVPEQQAILLAGGYGGGWRPRQDVWLYDLTSNEWTQLAAALPEPVQYCAGYYAPDAQAAVVMAALGSKRNKQWPVYALRLDRATAAKEAGEQPTPASDFHAKARLDARARPLPGEWLAGKGAPEDSQQVLTHLKSLPANQWVNMEPPIKPDPRDWGSYVYDPQTHRVFAWGGGHSAYSGSDVSEYDLTINRWYGQKHPGSLYPKWEHGRSVGIPGVTFFGDSALPCHARKAYGIDPVSRSLVLWQGDVYDLEQHCVVSHMGPCPPMREKLHPLSQPAYVTASHGLYAYFNANQRLYKADVAAGMWRAIDEGGPDAKSEFAHLSWDSKRDRIIYLDGRHPGVWAYSFADKKWQREEVQGKEMPSPHADSTYIAPLDAVLVVCASPEAEDQEYLYLYKLAERRWYRAPSTGDPFPRGPNTNGLNRSPCYDPALGVVIRVTPRSYWETDVHVMRLDPEQLRLTPY